MKALSTFTVAVFTSMLLVFTSIDVAEAKRLGGGQSFGGKFSQSQPVKRDNGAMQRQQAPQTPAQTQNAAAKQGMAAKGGMMGMIGALAIGGLLGALFFGGAFEGFNFFDFIMIALFVFAAFMLVKMLMQRKKQPATAGGPQMDHEEVNAQYRDNAGDVMGGSSATSQDGLGLDSLRGDIAKGFDGDAFLEGAKNCYARLQRAWDDGDLADIRQFTGDHVFAEIQSQLHNRIGGNKTEILDLDAELMRVVELGSKSEAVVVFNARLSENGNEVEVSEVWHFSRSSTSTRPTWILEGIQQIED